MTASANLAPNPTWNGACRRNSRRPLAPFGKQRTQLDDTYAAPDHPLTHATAMMALGSNMNLLDRYETRATRAYDRAVRNFDNLRARRKSAAAEMSFLPNEPEQSDTSEG